jgi:hypothetical protein
VQQRDDRSPDPLGEGFHPEPGYPLSTEVQLDLGPQRLTDVLVPPVMRTCPPSQRCLDLALGAIEKRTLRLSWSGLEQHARFVRAFEPVTAPSHDLPTAADIRKRLGSPTRATLRIELGKVNRTQGLGSGVFCSHWLEERVTLTLDGLDIPKWDGKTLAFDGAYLTDATNTQGACPPERLVGEPPPRCPPPSTR